MFSPLWRNSVPATRVVMVRFIATWVWFIGITVFNLIFFLRTWSVHLLCVVQTSRWDTWRGLPGLLPPLSCWHFLAVWGCPLHCCFRRLPGASAPVTVAGEHFLKGHRDVSAPVWACPASPHCRTQVCRSLGSSSVAPTQGQELQENGPWSLLLAGTSTALIAGVGACGCHRRRAGGE